MATKKEKLPKYSAPILEAQIGQYRYLVKADRESNCWLLERWKRKVKKPYQQWYSTLGQTMSRMRDMALQDTAPSLEGQSAVDDAIKQLVLKGFRPDTQTLWDK